VLVGTTRACCTALTHLALSQANLLDGGVDAPTGAAPAAVAQLRHFALCGVEEPVGADRQLARQLGRALQQRLIPHLTSLTCLILDGDEGKEDDQGEHSWGSVALAYFPPHVSTIASLQQLELLQAGKVLC
jgi:hypothetical protein